MMKIDRWLLGMALVVATLAGPAVAQNFGAEGPGRDIPSDSERSFPAGEGEFRNGDQGPEGRSGRGAQPSPMFTAIDADGDGVITSRELRRAGIALKKLDVDGDGNISLEEASPPRGPGRRGPGSRGPGGPMGPGGAEDPQAVFDRIMQNDKNGDGVLTPDEVPPQVSRLLSNADQNNDRVIDQNELRQAIEQMQSRQQGQGGGGLRGGFRGGNAGETLRRLMAGDSNGDGMLSPDEVPEQMMPMLRGADQDGDGRLDSKELQQAVRKAGSRGFNRRTPGERGPGGPPDRNR